MSPEQKTESLLVRMGATEARQLAELADHTGLTKADVIRQLIRREHSETLGAAVKAATVTQRQIEKITKPMRDATRSARVVEKITEPTKKARIKKP